MTILRPALLLDFARTHAIDPRGVFARIGAGTVRRPGGVWREVPSGAPRFDHDATALGLLAEDQRTNEIRNPRGEGVVPGTPGTLPTYWQATVTPPAGITREIIGSVTVDGLPGARIRWSGVAGTGGFLGLAWEANATAVASAAQVWTGAASYRLAGGSFAGLSDVMHRVRSFGGSSSSSITPTIDATLRRYAATVTMGASTTAARSDWVVTVANGATIDVTIDFVAPSLSQAPFAATPVLPAVGAPAASTRAADQLVYTLADFGVPSGLTVGTLVVAGRAAAGIGAAAQLAVAVDDGTADNRVRITRETSRAIRGEVIAATVSQGTATSVATVADSADFVVALAWAAGDLAISLNGAAPVTGAPAAIPATLSRLLLSGWGGAIARAGIWPQRVSNAALQSLAA